MNRKQIKSAALSAVLGVLSPLALVAPASAVTTTWGGGQDNKFSEPSNWGGLAPVDGETLDFPTSATYQIIDNDMVGLSLGKILFSGNNSGTSSKSYTITGNALKLAEGIDAVMTGSGGDHQLNTTVTLDSDVVFKTTGVDTLAVGGTSTFLNLVDNDLVLDASGGTITIQGLITGSGDIPIIGSGTVKFLATSDEGVPFTGAFSISSGVLAVDSALGNNVVIAGGTLKGTGTVGNVSMSAGTVAPGASPGVLNTGNLSYTGGSVEIELGGTGAGEFDQTNVTGTVDLGSATDLNVTLFGGFEPAVNDVFVIINNDGTDAVAGAFVGLADGDKITLNDYTYQINYDAGDGNDVTLLVTGVPSAPDTGLATLITSPIVTLVAAAFVLAVIGTLKMSELKSLTTKK